MNLYEYQAKKIFSKFNLPVLNGWLCSSICEVEHCIKTIQNISPWVLKCQIHAGGRGKSGGIIVAHSSIDVLSFANKWIGKNLVTSQTADTGEIVHSILIEPAVNIMQEFYLSILIDRDTYQLICMTSVKGGINIEKLIHESPNLLFKSIIDPEIGAYPYQGRIIAYKLGLTGKLINQFVKIFVNVIRMFLEKNLTLVEINPLVITDNDNLICLDAKVIVDHNALFKQSEILYEFEKNNKKSIQNIVDTNSLNVNYVALEGNIGCMVNGAGLAMATMDLMQSLGGIPANFLDIGGDTNKNCIISAFKMLLKNRKVKAILINIFGGIVCCDLVADGVIIAISECTNHIPIVARLEGNNAILGINRLINSHLNVVVINNLTNAIQHVINLVK